MGFIPGLFLACLVPLIFLYIIYKYNLYQTGQFKLILSSLAWGVFAYAVASLTHLTLEYAGLADRNYIVRFYAPVLEETFKGLILIVLVKRRRLTYSLDGALYGFAIGIGFAIFENIGYIYNDLSEALGIAALRIVSANLIHATSSAAIGIALAMFRLETSWLRWLFSVAGPIVAVGQHMLFNNIVSDGFSALLGLIAGILGLAFILITMWYGKKQAQDWIRQKLGMDDRITRGEVAAVVRLTSADDVLLPLLERFSPEKVTQVEKLLYIQARLALKRKALDSFPKEDPLRNAMEAEIKKTQVEMEAARRMVGMYAMLFVRGLFTDEMLSVWDLVQVKIRERAALNEGQKGGGLWTSLEERVKTSAVAERRE